MRAVLILALIFTGTSCGLLKGKDSIVNKIRGRDARPKLTSKKERTLYIKSLRFLKKDEYENAYKSFELYMRQNHASYRYQSAKYYSAVALEGMGRWREAADRYRAIIQSVDGIDHPLSGLSLVHLANCYDALGENLKSIATLHDAYRRRKSLPIEIWRAEIPSRLGVAYIRIDNEKKSQEYFKKAEEGLAYLKRNFKGKNSPEWWAKTLFQMGNFGIGEISVERFKDITETLSRLQTYLIQSVEVGHEVWSKKSHLLIMDIYNRLWDYIVTLSMEEGDDEAIARRNQNSSQVRMGILLLNSINTARSRRMPEELGKGKLIHETFAYLEEVEKTIESLVNTGMVDTDLTVEAKRRQDVKRYGYTVSPFSILESNAVKREKKKVEKKNEKNSQDEKDPNL